MKYPQPEGAVHNLIRDRARYLRRYADFTPERAFNSAMEEWRENNLHYRVVQPKTGQPYVWNRDQPPITLVTLKGNPP